MYSNIDIRNSLSQMRAALLVIVLCAIVAVAARPTTLSLKRHPQMHGPATLDYDLMRWVGSTSSESLPLGGNIFPVGIYYTEVQVGTPGRPYKVAIDTGSADLIIPGEGCDHCIATPTLYNPTNSSTSSKKHCGIAQCKFSNSYETCNLTAPTQTCTVAGVVWEDVFSLGGDLTTKVYFGSILHQTTNFQQFFVIDGVWGLAFEAVSNLHVTPPFQALVDAGLTNNVFSMCLLNNTGVMTVGGVSPKLYTGTIGYTPITGGDVFYQMDVTGLSLNGTKVAAPGQTIIDSGTNNVLLPANVWNALTKAFQKDCPNSKLPNVCGAKSIFTGACYAFTAEELSMFPDIELTLSGGTVLTMTGEDYMLVDPADKGICYGIGNTGPGGLQIVGDALMQSYYTVFDRANNRIGWAPVNEEACAAGEA